jgi:phage pi2 protein 07|tara:strand:- start:4040 stop:4417 length:378 start_codon:yes stop_codon:yes gene_type:complete
MIKRCTREGCHITYEEMWQGPLYWKEREELDTLKVTIPKQRVFATKEQKQQLTQILLDAGYPLKDIDIKKDGVRVGYWDQVDREIFDKMNKVIEFDPWDAWDEDTGDNWFYAYDQEPSNKEENLK